MVQPNAGLPIFSEGEARYDVTPEQFADHIRKFVGEGVAIVGGCCGTDDRHLWALAAALR